MQYCNDCFAKLDDSAKHCKACQSSDLRHFETFVTETPQDGDVQQTDAPKSFKVDRQYLVEPKPKAGDLPPKNLLYFPATDKERKQIEKKAVRGAKKTRRSALGRTIRSSNKVRVRNATSTAIGLITALVLAVPTVGLIEDHKEVSVETIGHSIQAWIQSFNNEKSLVSASKETEKATKSLTSGTSKAEPVIVENGFSVDLEKAFFTTKYDGFSNGGAGTTTLCINVVMTNRSNRLLPSPNVTYQLQGSDLHVYDWDMTSRGDVGVPTARFTKPYLKAFRPGEKYLVRLGYTVPVLGSYTLKISDEKGAIYKKTISNKEISKGWFDFKSVAFGKNNPGVGSKQQTGQVVMKLNGVMKGRLSDPGWDRFSNRGWTLFDVTVTNTQDLPLNLDLLDFDFGLSDGSWPESVFYSDLTHQLAGSIEKGESRRTTLAIPYVPDRDVVLNYERLNKQFTEYPNDTYVPQGIHWYVASSQIK